MRRSRPFSGRFSLRTDWTATLQHRGWPTLAVQPLTTDERRRLIEDYLRQSSKTLRAERIDRIAMAEPSHNPLYLRALVEELRVFGIHEKLDERIDFYLQARTPGELFTRILERYEGDYERERPGLVGEAMSLLWAARRGLTEDELLALLGEPATEPMPHAWWSPLYLAAEHALTSRSGRLTFFHDYLRQAVRQRYLPHREQQQASHRRLAVAFARRERTPRVVDELPWQWAQAEAWEELYGLLTDLDFFRRLWTANEYEVKQYWTQIESATARRLPQGYRAVAEDPTPHGPVADAVARLLHETGHPEEALRLWQLQAEHHRLTANPWELAAALSGQAVILADRGELDRALLLHQEEERLYRELNSGHGLQRSLGHQALIRKARGDLDEALRLLREQERLCRQLGYRNGLAVSLGNQALVLQDRGELDEALRLQEEAERMCRQLGNLDGLYKSLGNQGLLRKARGDLDEALRLHQEEEQLCRQLGTLHGLQASLGNQALIWNARGEPDRALDLHQEQERICRRLGNLDGLQISLGNQALILAGYGEVDEALRLHQEEERICREIGNRHGLQACLGNQGVILKDQGKLEAAMRLLVEQEQICRAMGNRQNLSISLGNQALVRKERGELDEAMRLHHEEEQLCRALGDVAGLAASLANQASVVAFDRGRPGEARPLIEEACRLLRERGFVALQQQIEAIRANIEAAHEDSL